jgi:serine/threonine protein kinase
MRSLTASTSAARVSRFARDRVDRAVHALEEGWRHGEPSLEGLWDESDPGGTMSVLAALVKADLRCRFARGRRPEVRDYLERFPALRDEGERVLSLIYEEFCLREERGEQPDPDAFCRKYEPWRDSLASQLKYHHLLSRVVGPPAPPPRFPEPGEWFQDFAIDSVLGQGGAARVYRARDDRLGGREVALKVSPDRGHEAAIMGRLNHEHIVPVHSVVSEDATQLRGLIMPYRPGLPLDEVIRRVDPGCLPNSARVIWDVVAAEAPTDARAPRPPAGAGWELFPMRGTYAQGVAWIVATLADAVAHAHAQGVQHRDIKPANVLLTLQNGPQLLDFNLAHDPHAADQAEAALRGGTLPYMAPEQLEAFIDPVRWEGVGPAADIYSLGLVMSELLTGEAPEVPDQSLPLPRAIRSLLDRRADVRSDLRLHNPAIPHALEAIARRCLEYDVADRYPSAAALAEDLQRFLAHRPLQTARNPSHHERLDNWIRRNWLRVGLAASLLAAALAATNWAVDRASAIERRGAFLEAQAALDADLPETCRAAVGLLEPLVARAPDSPLARLHLGAAQAMAGDPDRAALTFAPMLPLSDAVLFDCARRAPATVRRLEALGNKLARARYWRPARAALNAAIRLGSRSDEVLVDSAVVDEGLGDFATAHEKWSRILKAPVPGRPSDRIRLAQQYQARARVAVRLAESSRAAGTPSACDQARTLYQEALADLDRALAGIKKDVEREGLRANQTVRARALIGWADLDARTLGRSDAEVQYGRAREFLSQKDLSIEQKDLKALEERLKMLAKELEATPLHDSVAALGTGRAKGRGGN